MLRSNGHGFSEQYNASRGWLVSADTADFEVHARSTTSVQHG